jgi:Protein of unknown function (DUF3102)
MTTSITAERTQWAARISAAWQQSVTSIIETGWLLTEAKTALDHGEWLPMVETDLPFQRNTAQRLMKIAADSRLANRAHVPLLPPSWGTLYELTKLDDDTFDQKLRDGTINPEMQRKDVKRKLGEAAMRGDKISAITARSAFDLDDQKMSDGTGKARSRARQHKKADRAPTLDPRAWSMSTPQEREAFVKAVGWRDIDNIINAIEPRRGFDTLKQAWNAATPYEQHMFAIEYYDEISTIGWTKKY